MDRAIEFAGLAAVCIAAYAGFVIFHKRKDARLKRKWHALAEIGLTAVLVGAGLLWMRPTEPFPVAFIVLVFGAMSVSLIRNVRFCTMCGATMWPNGLRPAKRCTSCGSEESAV